LSHLDLYGQDFSFCTRAILCSLFSFFTVARIYTIVHEIDGEANKVYKDLIRLKGFSSIIERLLRLLILVCVIQMVKPLFHFEFINSLHFLLQHECFSRSGIFAFLGDFSIHICKEHSGEREKFIPLAKLGVYFVIIAFLLILWDLVCIARFEGLKNDSNDSIETAKEYCGKSVYPYLYKLISKKDLDKRKAVLGVNIHELLIYIFSTKLWLDRVSLLFAGVLISCVAHWSILAYIVVFVAFLFYSLHVFRHRAATLKIARSLFDFILRQS
jgi:hypothetical protein